ncbi:TOBE-like domain-containing protein [Synechococcus sp. GreenBA-s]|nr:TOBE-like domain-containing protein [Synechococcus sp. GreenBA-s]
MGTASEIHDHPAIPCVMTFVGEVNVLPSDLHAFSGTDLFVRPHDLELLHEGQGVSVPAVLRCITHFGKELMVELQLENRQTLNAQLPRDREDLHGLQNGDRIPIRPRASHQC